MAQTADGFLWIATYGGLYRYDGAHFDTSVSDRLPSPSVYSLLAEANGDLWIGYTFGGTSLLHAGHVTNIDADAIPGASKQFFRAPDGILWLSTTSGLARLEGSRWVPVSTASNYSGESPDWIGRAQDDLVVLTATAAFFLAPHSVRFERRARIWGQKVRYGIPAVSNWMPDLSNTAESQPNQSLLDSSGQLWISGYQALVRYRWPSPRSPQPVASQFTKQDGLTGDISALLEDREGNIWTGTEKGLDRLEHAKLQRLALPDSLFNPLLIAGDDGEVWVGHSGGSVLRASGNIAAIPSFGASVMAATRGLDGTLWLAGRSGLFHSVQGKVEKIAFPVGPSGSSGITDLVPTLQALAVDSQGAVWLSIAQKGLFRWQNGTWDRPGAVFGLPAGPAIRLQLDATARLWITYPNNQIAIVSNHHTTVLHRSDGLNVGNVLALDIQADHAWIGGDRGVEVLIGARFVPLVGNETTRFQVTSGIVETRSGELWLNTAKGIYRVPQRSVQALLSGRAAEVDFELFDSSDGLDSAVQVVRPGPTLMQAADGRLWISRYEGVWWIDPDHIPRNLVAPIVSIEDVSSAGKVFPVRESMRLPKGTRSLRIDYTAALMSNPEREHFQYRLKGVDEGWEAAGQRRQAYYTNLAPGNYEFSITAANGDGVWSKQPAVLHFSVAPTFYQTMWFKVVSLAVLLLIVTFAFFYRLEQIQERFRQRMRERHAERERIARDLHDTLLQGIQALLFRLQNWETDPALPIGYREEVAAVVTQARSIVIEGRDRILMLRRTDAQPADLPEALSAIGSQESAFHATEFQVSVVGEPRPVREVALDQLIDIGREAIRNSLQHARAARIDVYVEYRKQSLVLRVHDDGCGFDVSVLKEQMATGHFGLTGMRERAQQLGAQIRIQRNEPNGTHIEVIVPARSAFRVARKRPWRRTRDVREAI